MSTSDKVYEPCEVCKMKVQKHYLPNHMNAVHGVGGNSERTVDEINEAENRPIPRWKACHCGKICLGEKGVLSHKRAKHRAPAAEEEEEEGEREDEEGKEGDEERLPRQQRRRVRRIEEAQQEEQGAAEEELDDYDYGLLIAKTSKGFYNPHRSWIELMIRITTILLNQSCEEVNIRSLKGIIALQLLPGIVQRAKDHGVKGLTPIGLLRSILADENPTQYVIDWALHMESIRKPRGAYVEKIPNIERYRSKAEELVKEGRVAGARRAVGNIDRMMRGVVDADHLTEEEMAEKIRVLFPKMDERDILPGVEEDPPIDICLQLTANDMRQKGYHIRTGTSVGTTAWSAKVLKYMFDDRLSPGFNAETEPSEFHQAAANFANKMLRGEVCKEGRDLLVTCRLAMIDKQDEPGARPINMECVLMKFLVKSMKDEMDKAVGPIIGRLQLGAGVKMGPQIVGRLCDRLFAEGMVITQLDGSNAYGLVRKRGIYDKLSELCKPLVRFMRWKYEDPVMVRNDKGEVVAMRETGVGQGDPMAGAMYMIGTYNILLALEQKLRESEDECNELGIDGPVEKGMVYALYDDIYIASTLEVAMVNIDKIEPAYNEHGAKLNIRKSMVTGRDIDNWENIPEGWKSSAEGSIAVGIRFGRSYWKMEKNAEKLGSMAPPSQALSLLHPNSQTKLLHQSYSRAGTYVAHSVRKFEDIEVAAGKFDYAIEKEVARVAGVETSPVRTLIIQQPQREGGMGIQPIGGMEAEAGIISQVIILHEFIAKHYPNKYQQTLNSHLNAEIILGTSDGRAEWTEIDGVTHASMTGATVGKIMAKGKRNVYKKLGEHLISELGKEEETQQHAAFLKSAAGSMACAVYIDSVAGRSAENFFPRDAYVQCLRRHLGVGSINDGPEVQRCGCGEEYEPRVEKNHDQGCILNGPYRTQRHNLLCEALHKAMKKLFPGDSIEREQPVGQIVTPNARGGPDNVTNVRADIVWLKGAERIVIDVSIVGPEAKIYMKYPTLSHIKQDGAAMAMELKKKRYYRKVTHPNRIPEASVIPFVLESTGRLGPAAFSFLNRICATQTCRRSAFLSECGLLCARYAGYMRVAGRDRIAASAGRW